MSLALCSSNYSIGILNSMDDRVLSIQNNVIDGLSGDVSVVLFQSLNLRHTSYRLSFFTSMSISFLPLRMAGKLRWSHNSFVIDQILFFSIRKCQFKSIYEFRKSTVRSNETVEYLMNRDVSIRYHLMRKMETAGFLTTKFFSASWYLLSWWKNWRTEREYWDGRHRWDGSVRGLIIHFGF